MLTTYTPLPRRGRGRVRGSLRRRSKGPFDCGPDTLGILDHFICPEAQHPPSLSFQRLGPTGIGFDLMGMVLAVDCDDELSRNTREVGKVRPDRMLAPEFDAAQSTITQQRPADPLGATAVTSELAGSLA